jgi:cytochrome b involved in lipid metabolism
MNKTKLIVLSFTLVLFLALGAAYFINQSTKNQNDNTDAKKPIEISSEELSSHNNAADCWVTYQGKVYDLTTWITKHPGGINAILPNCGNTGFEEAFIAKHGSTKAALFAKVAILMGDFKAQGNLA